MGNGAQYYDGDKSNGRKPRIQQASLHEREKNTENTDCKYSKRKKEKGKIRKRKMKKKYEGKRKEEQKTNITKKKHS